MTVVRCLVTGATGYVGGRLVPRLVAAGHEVRCLTRSADRLRDVPWAGSVEIVEGDVTDAASLVPALAGVDVLYYLVHSLGQPDFEAVDLRAAQTVAAAAAEAGVRRIVYLGGPRGSSAHLRSRDEVATVFLRGPVPTVVLRAAVIIGSGSASFEMLRHLTERLPIMVTPRWVRNRIQPIAIRDVLRYLVAAASSGGGPDGGPDGGPGAFPADGTGQVGFPPDTNRDFDIGGPDVLTYASMMRRYAAVAGLRRRVLLPVRVLSPALSAHWVGLVTPVPNRIARPLVGSLVVEAVCQEHDIAAYVPDPPDGLTDFDTAVRLALHRVRDAEVETRWANARVHGAPSDPLPTDPSWSGGSVYTDVRRRDVDAPPERLWRVIEGIGGDSGWYSFPLAWSVRGWLDRLVGGVGLRRGRRDPNRLYVGEALDWWRVEEIIPGELLRLRAEMKLPGRAWLEMRACPGASPGTSVFEQRAVFLPRGLAGHLYWGSILPFHAIVFGGMARNIAATASTATGLPATSRPVA